MPYKGDRQNIDNGDSTSDLITKVNAMFEELFQPMFTVGWVTSSNTPTFQYGTMQTVPHDTWTDVELPDWDIEILGGGIVPTDLGSVGYRVIELHPGEVGDAHPDCSGMWYCTYTVAWDNKNVALPKHLRLLRVLASDSTAPGVWTPIAEVQQYYNPNAFQARGVGNLVGYERFADMQVHVVQQVAPHPTTYYRYKCAVWHNAGVPLNMVRDGFEAPLVMYAKLSQHANHSTE